MNKVQKIIYWLMLIILVIAITTDVVTNEYKSNTWKVNTLFWCLTAWLAEARCAKLQKTIDEINQYVNTTLTESDDESNVQELKD